MKKTPRREIMVETRRTDTIAEPFKKFREYEVWIVSGVQSFRLAYRERKSAAEWYAAQLRIALGIAAKGETQ